jgi:hypothetical protein
MGIAPSRVSVTNLTATPDAPAPKRASLASVTTDATVRVVAASSQDTVDTLAVRAVSASALHADAPWWCLQGLLDTLREQLNNPSRLSRTVLADILAASTVT